MEFRFKSSKYKIFLWCLLAIVLPMDAFGIWNIFSQNHNVGTVMGTFLVIGICIKLTLVYCVITLKGPIKGLLYSWGGMFITSGVFGLLAFMTSETIEPIQNYIDKGLFLTVGLLLTFPVSKAIEYRVVKA